MNRPVAVGVFVAVLAIVSIVGVSGPIMAAGGGGTGAETAPAAPLGTAEPAASIDSELSGGPFERQPVNQASNEVGSDDFDSTTFEITVHENGSATWTFRHEQRLEGGGDDETTQESFEAFAEEFNSTETELYVLFTEQAQAMADSGTESTSREMEATDFDRSARIEGQLNPVGVVEMSFTWHGFAAVDDGRVVAGDVFQNVYLTEDQTIVVRPDDRLRFQRAEPDGQYFGPSLEEADAVRWHGEREFYDGRPRVVFAQDDAGAGALSAMTDSDGLSWPVIAASFVVLLALGSGAAWYRRQDGVGAADADGATGAASEAAESPSEAPPDAERGSSPGAGPGSEPDPRAQPAAGPDRGPDAGPGAAATAADSSSGSDSDPLSDEELLTDEDRVVKLIRENGGRMKQVNIVEETGWSKSKVSMLLSDMEDEGTISKLRVGRENIISLDGYEPEATKSPFEEQ